MIAISITIEAYAAIRATLREGKDSLPATGRSGPCRLSLDIEYVNRLGRMRGPREDYSDGAYVVAEVRSI
jgi:hypothetical protein